jgi:hypothetical protein
MTVPDCISEYKHLAGDIFGRPRSKLSILLRLHKNLYSRRNYERICKDLVKRRVEASAGADQTNEGYRLPLPEGISRV